MTDFAAARTAMVDCQVRPSDVTLYPIIAAMLAVPRERFVPDTLRSVAYVGEHLRLGPGRVLLDPRVFAKMLDALNLDTSARVLDIGPGLGYSTAILAQLAGSVVAVEADAAMAAAARATLHDLGADRADLRHGPHRAGAPDAAPFDAMLVNGGVEHLPPDLTAQIRPGGRIAAIFLEGPLGQVRLGTVTSNGVSWRNMFDATAPLILGFERAREFAF